MIEKFFEDQINLQNEIMVKLGELNLVLIGRYAQEIGSLPDTLKSLTNNFKIELSKMFISTFLTWGEKLYTYQKKSEGIIDMSDIRPKLREFTKFQKNLILSILNKSQYFDANYFIDLCKLIKITGSSKILSNRLRVLDRKIKQNLSL